MPSLSSLKRCFISAPIGTDTSALRSELEKRDIAWTDQTRLEIGDDWLDVTEAGLSDADFVCIIIPHEGAGEKLRSNVIFELGMACAMHKPILAFITNRAEIPQDIRSLTYVISDLSDRNLVSKVIDTFIKHARKSSTHDSQSFPKKAMPRSHISSDLSAISGSRIEAKTASLFRAAGIILSEETRIGDKVADFAVWIDEVASSLGNPILVEVKSGIITPDRLQQAGDQLRHYMEKINTKCGIVVYWDTDGREYPQVQLTFPYIFYISGSRLTEMLSRGSLAKELIHLRNQAIHARV